MLEDRHIGLKHFGRSMPALPCFGMNTTLDTLQDSGMYLRATEALNSLHSWGRRISNPRCKQTGLTPSPPGALSQYGAPDSAANGWHGPHVSPHCRVVDHPYEQYSPGNVSPLLLCRLEKENFDAADEDEVSQTLPCVTHFIDPKELQLFKGHTKEHQGRISVVYRGVWRRKKKKKIDIALKVFKSDHHKVEEQLELLGQWASVHSPALVRLYGITLNSPLGMVMELLPLGPLDSYLRHQSMHVKEVDLVEAANYLATALWNLEEAGVVHGNVRCHKLLVAAHTDSSFVVRLADSGLSRQYTNNDIHWLAPECYQLKDNTHKTTASDVWAFGTTLWEIFSKGQHPSVSEPDLKKYYLSGKRLSQPKRCSSDLYRLMMECWTLDPQRRKKTQEAMRDINHLLYQVFNSRRMHSYAVALPRNHGHTQTHSKADTVSFSVSSSQSTIISELSMDSSNAENLIDFSKQWGESSWLLATSQELNQVSDSHSPDMSTGFSHLDFSTNTNTLDSVSSLQCIFELEADCNVVLQGRIGQGFYGEVYRGSLEQLDKDCEPQLVAVKRLKADSISANRQDFEREIDIMKRLKHENIVEIKAVISEPEVSLVMEFIPHGSLQCYLKINRDRLRPEHLLKFALDVAKGMDYLGHKNIVHRDLAARNILVASDSHVKISDFGLAQVMGSNDYYILKTSRELPIKWYAPESLRDGKFSPRSDMWSYGVTLFEMFSLGQDPQLPSLAEDSTDQAQLLAALEAGVRLPCPVACPQHIYVTIVYPCWLQDSHSRPTFRAMAQTIEQLRSTYLCAA
ncbi:Tyrosine-protein kinase jak2 [Homalodisca vitripennis]|nr:Tyrosine-protein kinase jak2 [Homalodisca vitripennis]